MHTDTSPDSVEEEDVTDREGNKVWNTKHCLRRLNQGQYKNAKNLDGGNIKATSEAAAVSNPISYSLTSLPQTALTEYPTLHKRRLSDVQRSVRVCGCSTWGLIP